MFEGDLRRKLEVTDSIQYEPDQLKYTFELFLVKANLISAGGEALNNLSSHDKFNKCFKFS